MHRIGPFKHKPFHSPSPPVPTLGSSSQTLLQPAPIPLAPMENDDNNRRRQLPPRYPSSVNFPSRQGSSRPRLSYTNPAPAAPRFTSGYGSGWNRSSYQMPAPPVRAAPLFTSGYSSGWNRSSFQMPAPPRLPSFTPGGTFGFQGSSLSALTMSLPLSPLAPTTTGFNAGGSGASTSSFLRGLFFSPSSFPSPGLGQLAGRVGLSAPTCSLPLLTFLDHHSSTPRLLPPPSQSPSPFASNFGSGDGEYELPPILSPTSTDMEPGEYELPPLPPSLSPSGTNFGAGGCELPPLPPSLFPSTTNIGSGEDELPALTPSLSPTPSATNFVAGEYELPPLPPSLSLAPVAAPMGDTATGSIDDMLIDIADLLEENPSGADGTGAGGDASMSFDPEPSSLGTNSNLVSPGQSLGATNTSLVSPGQSLGATNNTVVSPGLPGGNIDFETLGNLLLLSTGAGGAAGASSSSRSPAESWQAGQLVPWFADGTFTLEEVSKIMADRKLKDIVLTNPKEVRRVLGRRRSYHKSMEGKAKRTAELEAEARQLRSHNESLAAHLQSIEYATAQLQIDNNRLRMSREGLEQRYQLMEALLESQSANMHSENENAGTAIGYNPHNSLNPGIGAQTVLEQPNIPALMETPTADMYRGNLGAAAMNIGYDNPSSSNQEIGIPWVFPEQLDTCGEPSRRQEDQDKDGTSKHS